MSKYFSFITLLAVIILLIIVFYKVMAGFFIPLFLAALLVVIFRPLHLWMTQKCKNRQKLSAFLTTAAIMLSVLVPLAILFVMAAFESQQLVKSVNKTALLSNFEDARSRLNLKLPEIASELNAVEIQLDNINEMERLEDVANLEWQFKTTSLYHDDLSKRIDSESSLKELWEDYLKEFDALSLLQNKIAEPVFDGSADFEMEESSPNQEEETEFEPVLESPSPIADSTIPAKEENRDPAELLHDFQIQLSKTRENFDDFKVGALGGSPFWVWLRETANPTPDQLEEYGGGVIGYARSFLVDLGATTTTFLGRLILGTAIMVIALYFFLLDGPAMLNALKTMSPIDDHHEQELIVEFGKVSRAVVVATLLAALVQALLGGIGYYFAGLNSVFLLTLLTGCLALVPFVGAAAVWVPCVLWLYFVENNTTAAIGLAVYGTVVISMSDNLIKPLVLHGQSNLHPLFALLSVLGGVSALGPIGILIGPMVVAFLQTLLKILQREIDTMDRSEAEISVKSS